MKTLFVALLSAGLFASANSQTRDSTVKSETTHHSGTIHHSSQSSKPKVSLAAARKTVLARVPGAKVESEELELEHGRQVYSFDLKVPKKSGVEEVQVDANSGKVVSHTHESAEAERKEQAKEKSEGSKPH